MDGGWVGTRCGSAVTCSRIVNLACGDLNVGFACGVIADMVYFLDVLRHRPAGNFKLKGVSVSLIGVVDSKTS
jgi:hypothetical protein